MYFHSKDDKLSNKWAERRAKPTPLKQLIRGGARFGSPETNENSSPHIGKPETQVC